MSSDERRALTSGPTFISLMFNSATLLPLLLNPLVSAAKLPALDVTLQESAQFAGAGLYCPPCDTRNCPFLDPEQCSGRVVKDHCGCCPTCEVTMSSGRFQEEDPAFNIDVREDLENQLMTDIHPVPPLGGNCSAVNCPKMQICMLNMQELPICRCPTLFVCRRKKESGKICGRDGVTYRSRCHLQIAECTKSQKIRVAYKGVCNSKSRQEKQIGDEIHKESTVSSNISSKSTRKSKHMEKNKKGRNGRDSKTSPGMEPTPQRKMKSSKKSTRESRTRSPKQRPTTTRPHRQNERKQTPATRKKSQQIKIRSEKIDKELKKNDRKKDIDRSKLSKKDIKRNKKSLKNDRLFKRTNVEKILSKDERRRKRTKRKLNGRHSA